MVYRNRSAIKQGRQEKILDKILIGIHNYRQKILSGPFIFYRARYCIKKGGVRRVKTGAPTLADANALGRVF
jgi:hypothetical protein